PHAASLRVAPPSRRREPSILFEGPHGWPLPTLSCPPVAGPGQRERDGHKAAAASSLAPRSASGSGTLALAMDVISACPMNVGPARWQPRPGTWALTVVAKATLVIEPVECPLADVQE